MQQAERLNAFSGTLLGVDFTPRLIVLILPDVTCFVCGYRD